MGEATALDETVRRWLAQSDTEPDLRATVLPTAPGKSSDAILHALRRRSESAGPPIRVLPAILGKGGMAEVREGAQTALHRGVAVKRVAHSGDSEAASALIREAWLTAALEHPNIVPIYELSVDEAGNPVVVMRRIDGRDWGDYVDDPESIEAQFGVANALEWNLSIFGQVCQAVHYAHSRGVIHRDIKPRNVMIGPYGEVYLFDWGIALPKSPELLELLGESAGTAIAGTPCYLAPEMLTGETGLVDARTDVYLLGATLFEIVVGEPPHNGSSLTEVLDHVHEGSIEIPEHVPDELRSILEKALHRDKDQRFATADELRRAIDSHLSHRGSDKLALNAHEGLSLLRSAIHACDKEGASEVDWKALYRLYREARFGYMAALELWSENERARQELLEATTSMVHLELEHGTADAAAVLLAELAEPAPELAAEVEAAEEKARRERATLDALASRGRNLSPRLGAGPRAIVIFALGIIFAAKSLFFPTAATTIHLLFNFVVLGVVGAGLYISRLRLLRSAFNRRVVAVVVILICVNALSRVLGYRYGHDVPTMDQLEASLQLMGALVGTFLLVLHIWPIVPGYAVALVVAYLEPAYYTYAEAVAHLVLALFLGIFWRPAVEPGEREGIAE